MLLKLLKLLKLLLLCLYRWRHHGPLLRCSVCILLQLEQRIVRGIVDPVVPEVIVLHPIRTALVCCFIPGDRMRLARVEEDRRRSQLQLRPWPALLIGALLRPWAL